jgi:hypothetical protein
MDRFLKNSGKITLNPPPEGHKGTSGLENGACGCHLCY